MLSIDFLSAARRTALVAGAVALVAAAACSDDTTAPHARKASIPPTAAQGFLNPVPMALLTVQVRNAGNELILENPRVKLTAGGKDTVIVKDNDATDLNPTAGIISVSLPKAASMYYGACLFEGTATYGIDFTKSYCHTVWTSASTIDLGTLTMHQYPNFGGEMVDAATSKLVRGGQMKLIAPDGTSQLASDGGAGDIDGSPNGIINFWAKKGPGTYTYCETIPPIGYALTNPVCKTINLFWDVGIGVSVLHSKLASR